MGMHTLRHDDATYFADVVETVKAAAVRPQVHLTEVPAPRRIAPHAVAFSAEVIDPKNADDVLGTGRFVLLHDPASPEAWHGTWRIVTFARAELESEMATDPALGAVGWDWLLESLKDADAAYSAEAGTVTRVVNESFGGLGQRPSSVELEIRASWTPDESNIAAHLLGWANLMCTVAGLPPVPEGVTALPGRF